MWGEGYVVAAGKRLEYRCWGPDPGKGLAIVLLHEGLGCVALWRDFPEVLHQVTGLPVLAYSRAGYGMSEADDLPRDLDWMTVEAVQVLPDVLGAFDLHAPLLLGHSDGATIAAIHAGRVGGVAGAILMAPHFFTEDMGLAEIARAADAFETSDMGVRMAKYHRDPVAMFRGWADAWLSPGFRQWNVTDVLDDIDAPVLPVQGADDQYGTLAQIEVITDRCRQALAPLILPDCRHVPHLEAREALLPRLASFVNLCNIAHISR